MQRTRILLSSFIVILSRSSPQSDAQHDARAGISNGSIITRRPLMRGSPSCSISALSRYHYFRIRSDQSIKRPKDDQSQKVGHRGVSDCITKQRNVAETNQAVPLILLDRWYYRPLRLTTTYLPTSSLMDHYELRKCLKEIHGLVIFEGHRLSRESRSRDASLLCHQYTIVDAIWALTGRC